MARPPFILSSTSKRGQIVIVEGDEAKHLLTVLRFRTGDRFIGFDGAGNGWLTEIVSVDRRSVHGRIVDRLPKEQEPRPALTMAVGCVKGRRMDWAVEKAAELGAHRLIPLITEFSVVDPGTGKFNHWQAVALSAAKQSRRFHLMVVDPPLTIVQLLTQKIQGAAWFMHHGIDNLLTADVIKTIVTEPALMVIIGPEGGFSPLEIELIEKFGVSRVSLGDHPLRTETAVAVTTGMIMNLAAKSSGRIGA